MYTAELKAQKIKEDEFKPSDLDGFRINPRSKFLDWKPLCSIDELNLQYTFTDSGQTRMWRNVDNDPNVFIGLIGGYLLTIKSDTGLYLDGNFFFFH